MATESKKTAGLPENALVRKALEAITQIDREAEEKKLAQVGALEEAKANIQKRLRELEEQAEQLDAAIARVGGKAPVKERRQRRNLDDKRARVARWLEGRRGQKFGAGDLVREFPELEGVVIAVFLKPAIKAGKIQTDASGGVKRLKYFVRE